MKGLLFALAVVLLLLPTLAEAGERGSVQKDLSPVQKSGDCVQKADCVQKGAVQKGVCAQGVCAQGVCAVLVRPARAVRIAGRAAACEARAVARAAVCSVAVVVRRPIVRPRLRVRLRGGCCN